MEKLGPYKLDGVLGTGGMGKVYAAVNEETGQNVAVKVLSPAYAADSHFRARFGTEIQSLKKLRHVGIVELYGYGEQDGHLFYAMELVQGKSLADQIRAGRRFEWPEVVRIGIDICAALRHAHDHGVIHRDLKPANLMLGENNLVKLTDFGIAKLFGATQLTADGGVIGTADFMSPEQAEGRPATIRSDLYSLGSVLYAMLARRSPFAAGTMAEVIHGLMYDDPPPLEQAAPDTPRELGHIIHRLLEKDPEKRIGTALAVSNRLSEIDLRPRNAGEIALSGFDQGLPAASERESSDSTDVPASETSARPTVPYRRTNARGTHDAVTRDAPTSESTMHTDFKLQDEPSTIGPPVDHFTTVERSHDSDDRGREDLSKAFRTNWPALIVLLLTLVGGGVLVWAATRPESADALFDRIRTAAADNPARLAEVESELDVFLERFPQDPRHSEVAGLKSRLEVEKWLRQVELKSKLAPREQLAPVQLLLSARRLAETDPDRASRKLSALIALLETPAVETGDDQQGAPPLPDTPDSRSRRNSEKERRMCLAAAESELMRVREAVIAESRPHLALIRQELRRAEKSPADEAQRIRQSIVELYADKEWAKAEVAEARANLKPMPAAEEQSPITNTPIAAPRD
ncbi:MAG: serine/threonine-protein kinase [Pirellulaceae bacterium]